MQMKLEIKRNSEVNFQHPLLKICKDFSDQQINRNKYIRCIIQEDMLPIIQVEATKGLNFCSWFSSGVAMSTTDCAGASGPLGPVIPVHKSEAAQ